MTKNTLLIFDCDGVLVDSELISLGLLIDHCNRHGLSLNMQEACECFLGKPVAVAADEANRIHGSQVPDVDLIAFQEEVLQSFSKSLAPVPGIADALSGLPHQKCVASSSNLQRIQTSLDLTKIANFFNDKLFSTDMVERGKPHPDVFLYAAKVIGFAPEKCIVIEDSPAGLEAAHAAGMKTIAYSGGSHATPANLKNRLEVLSPGILIDHMSSLRDAIDSLSN